MLESLWTYSWNRKLRSWVRPWGKLSLISSKIFHTSDCAGPWVTTVCRTSCSTLEIQMNQIWSDHCITCFSNLWLHSWALCCLCFPVSGRSVHRGWKGMKSSVALCMVIGLERCYWMLDYDTSFPSPKQVSSAAREWTDCGVHSGPVFQAEI